MQLVVINMSDHYTRMRFSVGSSAPVLGCLLGSQSGRTVDISNSFELKYSATPEGVVDLDMAFLTKKQEQCECQAMSGLGALHFVGRQGERTMCTCLT